LGAPGDPADPEFFLAAPPLPLPLLCALVGLGFITSTFERGTLEDALGGARGGDIERERDLLAGPNPASTCILSESVVGLRAPPLLGDAEGESVVIGGRVIAPLEFPGPGAGAGGDDVTTALGGGGSGREDGMPVVNDVAVVGDLASSDARVACRRKGMGVLG